MTNLETQKQAYEKLQKRGLSLNITRGQPPNEIFDRCNDILTIVNEDTYITPSGVDVRNYPGGIFGLAEARKLFAGMIGVEPEEVLVGNNASLPLMANTLQWALLRGLKNSDGPWVHQSPKMIVTVPGYDRHFKLLAGVGIELVPVEMTPDGPDIEAVEKLAASDASIKGIFFVPTYSNPTGDTISNEVVRRLASMKTAASDFTILADDAYCVHHFGDPVPRPLNLLKAAKEAGNPDRVILFGSTSKVTLASAGIGFMAAATDNLKYLAGLFGLTLISPNKAEQYRHVRFLETFPGGLPALMDAHASVLWPKFQKVLDVLTEELSDASLANWTKPRGGYFISLDTKYPVASRVVQLAKEAGVALTPAGATFPGGIDPDNCNIRLAPSQPPIGEVEEAMHVVATCIKLASAEYESR